MYTTVIVRHTPISERYCNPGDYAVLDTTNNQIRCSGAWFPYTDLWIVEPVTP